MYLDIDPVMVSWLIIVGASFCTFMVGKEWSKKDQEVIIEDTIMYLIENNFIKAKRNNGEWEIMDLDDH
jgi:hypothetical protein